MSNANQNTNIILSEDQNLIGFTTAHARNTCKYVQSVLDEYYSFGIESDFSMTDINN
jgi:hypothetical protein